MRAALIVPTPDLERFHPIERAGSDIHMLLATQMESGPYLAHYGALRARGDYLLIDNGAWKTDGGEARDFSLILWYAQVLGAQEVILPDSIGNYRETWELSKAALDWLRTEDGRTAYERAHKPKLMVVPQGETLEEWLASCGQLLMHTAIVMGEVGGPDPVIGVSKFYGQGIIPRLEMLYAGSTVEVHLLGWAGTWGTLATAAERFPDIRSVDSARPFNYAREGRILTPDTGYDETHVSRVSDYFHTSIPAEHRGLARENISRFKGLVGDT